MDNPMKLSAKLPKEHKTNGLDSIYDQVERHGAAYAIVYVQAYEVTERADGTKVPTLTIDHIEGLPTGELADAAGQLMSWARAVREYDGQTALISKEELINTIRGTGTAAE